LTSDLGENFGSELKDNGKEGGAWYINMSLRMPKIKIQEIQDKEGR
jgi:hypothetical protein